LSTLTVLAVFIIAKHLTGNKLFALLSAAVMSINPWSFLMGRTVFEVNFYLFFMLWAFILIILNRGFKILYGLPLFILGFFSYTGGQLSFYLFICITLIYKFLIEDGRKSLKPYAAFFTVSTAVLVFYLGSVFYNQPLSSRGSELYTPFNPQINEQVNYERSVAATSPLNGLFINKATVYAKGFLERYYNAFSVNNLFLNGEARAAYSYQEHGTFYFIDLAFMLIGFAVLFKMNKKGLLFLCSVIAASIITSALSIIEFSYSQRSGFMFPFLTVLIGTGIGYVVTFFKSAALNRVLIGGVAILYIALFANLMHIYFFRFPVYASDGWFYQDRILSRYINLVQEQTPGTKVLVSVPEPKIIFQEYLFFNNLYNSETVKEINGRMDGKDYSLNNVIFTDSCPEEADPSSVFITDPSMNCDLPENGKIRITRFKDLLENYIISGDTLCKNWQLGAYVSPMAFTNFNLEGQDSEQFCKNWLTKLD
jgi:hypothetical protein